MRLEVEEIVPYLKNGGVMPDGALLSRVKELMREVPIRPRTAYLREGNRMFLCGTIGSEFDVWQRRISLMSSADALISQAIGAAAIERVMDELEAEAASTIMPDETLQRRRSPGYGQMPLEFSAEILRKLDGTRRVGVAITDSLLLVPSKSVTAVCEIVGK